MKLTAGADSWSVLLENKRLQQRGDHSSPFNKKVKYSLLPQHHP
jgi:hypothetical protein